VILSHLLEAHSMTASDAIHPQGFWDAKILRWEADRYGSAPESWLERIAHRASDSVRFRMELAARLLTPHVRGRKVIEVGCGSGLLAGAVVEAGAASYTGFDISTVAIAAARERAASAGLGRACFVVADAADLKNVDADVVVSLGLVDWLDDAALETLFAVAKGADVVHTFSERRASPAQWLHRLYVHLAYGRRTGAYIPRYHAASELVERVGARKAGPVRVVRDARLSFGAFLTTLPENV
jgi:SAM-dependent methyltransferase